MDALSWAYLQRVSLMGLRGQDLAREEVPQFANFYSMVTEWQGVIVMQKKDSCNKLTRLGTCKALL